ncbi:MAG TPA: AbrB/MazE/SpoVT family DNA-binding domain-containing protein [Bacillota bacterium]|nr:AbrB/MazE/SpoVT family DNA-binding domain-containing protein [Bacillota bacterium]
MRTTGIVRKVDELGRIVIPKETREQLYIAVKDPMEIFIDDEQPSIILKKYTPGCIFCGEMNGVKNFSDKLVCQECLAAIKNEYK